MWSVKGCSSVIYNMSYQFHVNLIKDLRVCELSRMFLHCIKWILSLSCFLIKSSASFLSPMTCSTNFSRTHLPRELCLTLLCKFKFFRSKKCIDSVPFEAKLFFKRVMAVHYSERFLINLRSVRCLGCWMSCSCLICVSTPIINGCLSNLGAINFD